MPPPKVKGHRRRCGSLCRLWWPDRVPGSCGSTSPHRAPPWTWRGSDRIDRDGIAERSITIPSSQTAVPATLWPPLLVRRSRGRGRGRSDCRGHVGGAAAAGDQSRPPIDGAVPYGACVVVSIVAGCDHVAPGSRGSASWLGCWHRFSFGRWAHRNISTEEKSAIWTLKYGIWTSRWSTDAGHCVMRTYGQYCSDARGAEIFAERWTLLIIRNVQLGCEPSARSRGRARLPPARSSRSGSNSSNASALSSRRRRLTAAVTVTSSRVRATICSRSARPSARVGARWLEIAPENLDPYVALWSMCNALRRDRLPDQRGHPAGFHRLSAARAVLVAARAWRGRDL